MEPCRCQSVGMPLPQQPSRWTRLARVAVAALSLLTLLAPPAAAGGHQVLRQQLQQQEREGWHRREHLPQLEPQHNRDAGIARETGRKAARASRRLSQDINDACGVPLDAAPLVPTQTPSPVIDIEWLDANDQKVVAFTRKIGEDIGGFWISQDGGSVWLDRGKELSAALPAGTSESVEVRVVLSQESSPKNVVLFGAGSHVWSSGDYGYTVTAKQTPGAWLGRNVRDMRIHPWHDDWLLVLAERPNCSNPDQMMTECPHDLFLTKDLFGAMTWANLTEQSAGKISGFVDFDWGAALCPGNDCAEKFKVTDDTILATMYADAGAYDQLWDSDVSFVISSNGFVSFDTHMLCGNQFEVIGGKLYLAFANTCPTDITGGVRPEQDRSFMGIVLYTSEDGGNTFKQGCMPVALNQEGYELLATQDGTGAVVIADFVMKSGYEKVLASSVYTAGPHHALFSLSLPDVYRAAGGYLSDFVSVEGLPGVYLANQVFEREPDYTYNYYDAYGPFMPLVQTRITFNGGASWERIPAPMEYAHAHCDRCGATTDVKSCSLHLRSRSTWESKSSALPGVYSRKSAPGLIMATGVVTPNGAGLEDDAEGHCTWLSSDGGVTWRDVAVGAYIYEYADWGSTIVMAAHAGLNGSVAAEVLFSTDFGRCWQTVPLSVALYVSNIGIEPDGQRPRVILTGVTCPQNVHELCSDAPKGASGRSKVPSGVMYVVDVKELMGGLLSSCTDADYEDFFVPNRTTVPLEPACILGKQMYIQRRRADSACLYGPSYRRPQYHNTTCTCTADDDLECEYGWIRTGIPGDNMCHAIRADVMPKCPVVENGEYTPSSTGRRLVHADVCTGVEALVPDRGDGSPDKKSPPMPTPTDAAKQPSAPPAATSSPPPPKPPLPQPPHPQLLPPSGSSSKPDASDEEGRGRGMSVGGVLLVVLAVLAALAGCAFSGWWLGFADAHQKATARAAALHAVDALAEAVAALKARAFGGGGAAAQCGSSDLGYFQPLTDEPTEFARQGHGTELQGFR
mmetsp:Transcript_3363/g.9396  ORF Transcript_3363/g.9396 Transcript_3363/m.9396 type:complete len:1023 (-) Transcript_3363:787-3855(-)